MARYEYLAQAFLRLRARWSAKINGHPRLALVVVVAIVAAPGLSSIPPLDRDKPRFAQAARQMVETGDFIDIRFQDAPLYEKPILTYWLQAGTAALFGGPELDRIWAYRLSSALAFLVATLLTYELALTLFDRRVAVRAATVFASMLLVQSQAHQTRADALLLAAMLGSVLALAHVYASRGLAAVSRCIVTLFWVSLAASILIKGPIAPALVALTVITLSLLEGGGRWLAPLRLWWGVSPLLLIVLPWPLLMFRSHGTSFFVDAWQNDILPKLVSAEESHGAPPFSYLLLAPLTLWPATLLLPSAVQFAWRSRKNSAVRFCATSIIPGWLLFERAPTKLPHYVLPLVPPVVVLAAACSNQYSSQTASRTGSRLEAALFVLASLLIVSAVVFALARFGTGLVTVTMLPTLALAALATVASVDAWRNGIEQSVAAVATCGVLASVTIFGITMPRLDGLWVADRVTRAVHTIAAPSAPTLVVGYREPSMVFLLGTRTRFVDASPAAEALEAGSGTAAIVASSRVSEFAREARARRVAVTRIATVDGIDPVHGRPLELGVWTNRWPTARERK